MFPFVHIELKRCWVILGYMNSKMFEIESPRVVICVIEAHLQNSRKTNMHFPFIFLTI